MYTSFSNFHSSLYIWLRKWLSDIFSSDSAFNSIIMCTLILLCLFYLCVSQSGVICKSESHTFTVLNRLNNDKVRAGQSAAKPCQENLHTPQCSSPILPESSFLWECKSLHYQTAANIVTFSVWGAISLPWVWKHIYYPGLCTLVF